MIYVFTSFTLCFLCRLDFLCKLMQQAPKICCLTFFNIMGHIPFIKIEKTFSFQHEVFTSSIGLLLRILCFLVYCCLWWHLFTPICISSHTSHYPCPHNMCVFSAEALNSNMIIQLVIDCSAQWLVHMWLKIEIITFTLTYCNLIYNSAYIIAQFTFSLDADDDVEFHFKHLHCACSIYVCVAASLPIHIFKHTELCSHTDRWSYMYLRICQHSKTRVYSARTTKHTQIHTDRREDTLGVPICTPMCEVHMHPPVPWLHVWEHEPPLKSESSGSTPQRSLSFPSSLQQSVTKTQSFSLMILK